MLALSAWRWRRLLDAQGFPVPLRRLTSSYLVASFFNNFLPSNIGGDVIRVRDSARLTGTNTTTSLAVIAIDRILGFGALYVLAVARLRPRRRRRTPPRGRAGRAARPLPRLLRPRLRVLPARAAPRASWPGAASTPHPWARVPFETVQAAVHVYRERMGVVWLAFRRQPGPPGLRRPLLLRHRPRAADPAAALGVLPDGAPVHAAPGGARILQRMGPAREPVHPLLRPGRAIARERARLQPRRARGSWSSFRSRGPWCGPRAAPRRPKRVARGPE